MYFLPNSADHTALDHFSLLCCCTFLTFEVYCINGCLVLMLQNKTHTDFNHL